MVGLSFGVMMVIAISAIVIVSMVVRVGTREKLEQKDHVDHSRASEIWQERAKRVDAARQSLVVVAEGGSAGGIGASGGSIIGTPDEAEVRKQAALARKAARAAKSE